MMFLMVLLGFAGILNGEPAITRSECDQIHYGYCRLDEGNQFKTDRLRGVASLTMELCQTECTLDMECNYFIWENEQCTFMRDPDQYFSTCRTVASSPHSEFERCAATNRASGCSKTDTGPRKKNDCMYGGPILERMPTPEGAEQCEAACRLRNSKILMRALAGEERCEFFVYDSEPDHNEDQCQLLGATTVDCYRELGPSQEKGACLFDGVIFPTESSNEVVTTSGGSTFMPSLVFAALLVSLTKN